MLLPLLAKDLRRARRNPLPWAINLIVPLVMTALIGLVFGGQSDNGAMGRIRFAIVDEDKTALSDFLRGAAGQREGSKFLDPVYLDRDEALREINANTISAVLIIPTNFMRDYLTARRPVTLELIKNPAESIHPAILQELLGAATTALNALSRNFNSEFPAWKAAFESDVDFDNISKLIERAGDKLKIAKKFIYPPLVSYQKESPVGEASSAKTGGSKNDTANELFGFLLIGLAAMFLLFIGSIAMNDLYRELRQRTFSRYQTFRDSIAPFVASKAVFAVVMLLISSAIMLGGGGLIFRIHWRQPIALAALCAGYALFSAGLSAAMVALMPDERRASVLNNLASMGLGMVGGCAFPPQQLPAFLRMYVTPHLPSFWFVNAARNLQDAGAGMAWIWVSLKLAAMSFALLCLAAILFRRRFKSGLRV